MDAATAFPSRERVSASATRAGVVDGAYADSRAAVLSGSWLIDLFGQNRATRAANVALREQAVLFHQQPLPPAPSLSPPQPGSRMTTNSRSRRSAAMMDTRSAASPPAYLVRTKEGVLALPGTTLLRPDTTSSPQCIATNACVSGTCSAQ